MSEQINPQEAKFNQIVEFATKAMKKRIAKELGLYVIGRVRGLTFEAQLRRLFPEDMETANVIRDFTQHVAGTTDAEGNWIGAEFPDQSEAQRLFAAVHVIKGKLADREKAIEVLKVDADELDELLALDAATFPEDDHFVYSPGRKALKDLFAPPKEEGDEEEEAADAEGAEGDEEEEEEEEGAEE